MVEQIAFQLEGGGSIPTSPLQFEIHQINFKTAVILNRLWHSRLPEITNVNTCTIAFGAFYEDRCWAIAIWGRPVARSYNKKPVLELRRMAIAPDAPNNTASRMIAIMIKIIKTALPNIRTLISYQDTDVHLGTIYKASNWKVGRITKKSEIRWGKLNKDGSGRKRNPIIATGDKIRWEYQI